MNQEIEKKVLNHLEPIVAALGYELVEVQYKQVESEMALTLFIDFANGITLEDCQAVSRAVDEPLDALNPTNDAPYNLNVSSLGLDRPLKTERDFVRAINKDVEIVFTAENAEKTLKGTIKEVQDGTLTINEKGKIKQIQLQSIISALPVIKF